jgi:2-polyprenyl-3-methyl-5-hydroxy-6-metoxy-1,4-benzoquinol methylase
MLLKYSAHFEGRSGLELGCNVGATATVLALMGARVTAVDIKEEFCALAALNASRYGVTEAVSPPLRTGYPEPAV